MRAWFLSVLMAFAGFSVPGTSVNAPIGRFSFWWRKVNVTREEAYRKLLDPGNLFTESPEKVLRDGQEYLLKTSAGETFSGRVESIHPLRGFYVSVCELNDALLLFTIEGVSGKIEVQAWLLVFGLPQPEVDQFSVKCASRLKQLFAN